MKYTKQKFMDRTNKSAETRREANRAKLHFA